MEKEQVLSAMGQKVMLEHYWKDVKKQWAVDDNRVQRNVMYRNAFMVAANKYSSLSITSIAKILGKHHAMVIWANKNHEVNLRFSKVYYKAYEIMSHQFAEMFMFDIDFSEYNGLKDENKQLRERLMNMSRRNRHLIMESKFHEEVVNDMQKKVDQLKADNDEKQMSLNMLNKKIAGIVY